MYPPQPPALQIFIRVQTMLITDMPTQHSPQIAAIQANDIIMPYRLPHWYSGRGNVLGLIWP
jgi:hypothetical protein